MIRFDIPAETRTVLELLEEKRSARLNLNPEFQRRSVWRPVEKSHLIDTVLRGLPIPLIILRHRTDIESKKRVLEVADGQQRLRTLFAYIEPEVLGESLDPAVDIFTVRKAHNNDPEIYGKAYADLPEDSRQALLDYRLNVVFLPTSMEDRDVLDIFARLNSTGLRLTPQELRNANYSGEFKSLMYKVARENFERWKAWKVLTPQDIARMKDVELVSDITNCMINGLQGKTKGNLDRLYAEYDESFPRAEPTERRLSQLFTEIGKHSDFVSQSAYTREIHFFILCVALYDEMFGLGSPLTRSHPEAVGSAFWERAARASTRYETGRLPKSVIQASQGAATDLQRRRIRLSFLKKA